MEVQILYDKESINRKLYSGWGVSFLINGRILFDTGENGRRLLHNMEKMDTDVEDIEIVVISHDHWDHTGGLWDVLKIRKGLKVYICPDFSDGFKKNIKRLKGKIIEAEKVTEIDNDIFITGEIAGEYKKCFIAEQALVAATEKGLTIMTGCSHPGIVKIVEQVKKDFPDEKIYLVFGGFHLMDKSRNEIKLIAMELKNTGIEKAGPTHCSGYNAEVIFKEVFDNNFVSIKAGQVLEI